MNFKIFHCIIALICGFSLTVSSLSISSEGTSSKTNRSSIWIYSSIYKDVIEKMSPSLDAWLQQKMGDRAPRVQWYQGGSEAIAAKITLEQFTGRTQADVVMTADPLWYLELKHQGLLLKYESPAHRSLPAAWVDKDQMFAMSRFATMVIAHPRKTPESMQAGSRPKSWKDLTQEKYKNLLSVGNPLESGTNFLSLSILEQRLGSSFLEALSENHILAAGGGSSVLNRIETGEKPIGIALLENILKVQKKGIAIEAVYPEEGLIPIPCPMAILKSTRNVEASQNVYDFFFSPEAQKLFAENGMYTPTGISPLGAKPFEEIKAELLSVTPEMLETLSKERERLQGTFKHFVLGTTKDSGSLVIPAFRNSILLALSVTLFSGLLGLIFAWAVERTDFPGRTKLQALLTLPYTIPAYLLAMAWIVLANPQVGWLRHWLPGIYGMPGMIFLETTVAFTFVFLELRSGFSRLDPALEEAARISGASPFAVFRKISFPLLLPSLLQGSTLAFLYSLASFGVPALLGLPKKTFVLTTLIYFQLKQGNIAALKTAAVYSSFLLVFALGILALSRFLQNKLNQKFSAISLGKSSHSTRLALSQPLQWLLCASLSAWAFITLVLPFTALTSNVISLGAGLRSNFKSLFNISEFKLALINSLTLTVNVSIFCLILGFLLGFFSVRRKNRLATFTIDGLSLFFSAPGSAIALLLLFIAAALASLGIPLRSTLFWIAAAYALKTAALSARTLSVGFQQVHPSLEEAAVLSGASLRELMTRIWVPLLRANMKSALFLTALPLFTELTMSVMLTGPGAPTLGTLLFDLQEYSDQGAAATLAWLLLSLAIFFSLTRIHKARQKDSYL